MENHKSFFSDLQNALPSMSEAKRSIAEYLMENWQEAVFLSAGKIARKVGVSESVVVRFAQDLGYSGFPELQGVLQTILRHRMTGVSDSLASIEDDQELESITDKHSPEVVQLSYNLTLKNLQATLYNNDFETILKAVDKIVNSRRIVIIASRNALGPATILAAHLNEIFTNTLLVAAGLDDMFDHLRPLTEEDLLITFGHPSYSTNTVKAAKFAEARKVKQISFTDSLSSPLALPGVTVLLTSFRSYSFATSHVSTVFLIEILLHIMTKRDNGKVIRSVEEIELLNRTYGLTTNN
ncbi:MurR/RpiR family transcriptional regulator [Paenibacillus terreus]|uniref:MurR/RpiR family transcriptional regulator n=1 Tax=Paenibacillus terreus TaxID=1387834 RepID=A0ABV5B5U7_9BACL